MKHERYAIDAAMSRVTVRPFASTAFPAAGQTPTLAFRNLTGEARFAPGTLDEASVLITIEAGSLVFDGDDWGRDRDQIEDILRRAVLESDKYPEIVFRSLMGSASKAGDGQYWINLVADLSLHGVTAGEPLAAQVVFAAGTLFVRGELTLLQSVYKMKPANFPGGSLRLREEIKCLFAIVARRQPETAAGPDHRMLAVEGS